MTKNNTNPDIAKALTAVLAEERLLVNEPLSKHTTFQIGGPADYFAVPETTAETAAVLRIAQQYQLAVTILGNGSNVLVRDKGVRGLVIKFNKAMGYVRHEGRLLKAGAGALLADVSHYAAKQQLQGMEFAVGIPGSIGGAVFMNAGAYCGEIGPVVEAVTAVCLDGQIRRFTREMLDFSYRHSVFQDNHCVICEVELLLEQGEQPDIIEKMDDFTLRRESKQPLEMPSAGSTFKRPPGHFAGTLIEQAGLKGLTVGGAQVSTKHAGFVINAGGATARDVQDLIQEVQRRVFAHAGVMLHPEVRIIGEE